MADRLDWLFRPFAHRGLHDGGSSIVENTSSAFQAAIDAGYGIECDVRQSGDGEIVVFHDPTLERLTIHKGIVPQLPVRQLKQATFKRSPDRIQTLSELLDQVSGRVPIIIEMKSDWKTHGPMERRLAEIVQGYPGAYGVMSFDPYSLKALAESAPGITRGLVAWGFDAPLGEVDLSAWQRFKMRHLLSAFIARPQFVNYDLKALASPAPWAWRHILRRPLLTWTVRTPQQARWAAHRADAIVFEGFRP